MEEQLEIKNCIEIIDGKLYIGFHEEDSLPQLPTKELDKYALFTIDPTLVYTAFFADFGPLDLGLTYKFCNQLHDCLSTSQKENKIVLFSCSKHPHQRSIGAVLICSYLIFVLNFTVENAYGPFIGIEPPLIPFRDAGFCINTFPITVLDCVKAMYRAVSLGHYSFKTFSLLNYQHLAKLQHGDFSWIIPGKFLAFSGPLARRRQLSPGVFSLTPEGYVPIMKKLNVSCIVRFNSKCYDRNIFIMHGIRHVDLFYEDGGNPTETIVQSFLQLCEQEKGAIAVHCKAGLGRTGTNIAAYMMKHFNYTAKEAIAWCRLCRPGCVVGPQQQYLESIESKMTLEGDAYREKNRLSPAITRIDSEDRSTSSNSIDSQSIKEERHQQRPKTPPLIISALKNKFATQSIPNNHNANHSPQKSIGRESLFHSYLTNDANNTNNSTCNNDNAITNNYNNNTVSPSSVTIPMPIITTPNTNTNIASNAMRVGSDRANSSSHRRNNETLRPSTSGGLSMIKTSALNSSTTTSNTNSPNVTAIDYAVSPILKPSSPGSPTGFTLSRKSPANIQRYFQQNSMQDSKLHATNQNDHMNQNNANVTLIHPSSQYAQNTSSTNSHNNKSIDMYSMNDNIVPPKKIPIHHYATIDTNLHHHHHHHSRPRTSHQTSSSSASNNNNTNNYYNNNNSPNNGQNYSSSITNRKLN